MENENERPGDDGRVFRHGRKRLDQVRDAMRRLHDCTRTEDAYVHCVNRFILFHGKRHPLELGKDKVVAFLDHLAVERTVAASIRNQALAAVLFLDKVALDAPLEWVGDAMVRAKRPERLPVVLTREEVRAVMDQRDGTARLAAGLMYGGGLRLMECLRLRVKDVDDGQNHLLVLDGKGQTDRVTLLPARLHEPLRDQIEQALARHNTDLADGFGRVHLPFALSEIDPSASPEPGWPSFVPAPNRGTDPRTGIVRRHHLAESGLQTTVRKAVRQAGLIRTASCHTLRHNFATHLLESGHDTRTAQERFGHK